MRKEKRYFAIGAFVLSSLMLLILAGILFGGGDLFPKKCYFETYFNTSIQGLDVGSAVKFRGVSVGKVESISFTQQIYPNQTLDFSNTEACLSCSYVRILCSLDLKKFPNLTQEQLEMMKTLGLSTTLSMQGITGGMLINLDFFSEPAPQLSFDWTPEEVYIPSRPTQLENFINVAEKIATNIEKIDFSSTIDSITKLTDQISLSIEKSNIPHLTESCLSLVTSLNNIAQQINNYMNDDNVKDIIVNLKDITQHIASITSTVDNELPTFAQSSTATIVTMQESLSKLNETLTTISTLLKTVATEVDFGDISNEVSSSVGHLSRTLSALEALIHQIRERPSRLLIDDKE